MRSLLRRWRLCNAFDQPSASRGPAHAPHASDAQLSADERGLLDVDRRLRGEAPLAGQPLSSAGRARLLAHVRSEPPSAQPLGPWTAVTVAVLAVIAIATWRLLQEPEESGAPAPRSTEPESPSGPRDAPRERTLLTIADFPILRLDPERLLPQQALVEEAERLGADARRSAQAFLARLPRALREPLLDR
jgi:hypothetical protein